LKHLKNISGIPSWALSPFIHFEDDILNIMDIVRCSSKGIDLFLAANIYDTTLVEKHLNRRELKIARNELKSGLPTLHSWAVVGLWAYLESLFKNFVETWIKNTNNIFENKAIGNIQISIGEYELIPKEQKPHYIAASLEKELKITYKSGISRFEEYLKPFNLSGKTSKLVDKKIYEFNKVRNLITHRSCYVDKLFLKECPWVKGKFGSKLQVSKEMYLRYIAASLSYCSTVICRIGSYFNVNITEYQKKEKEMEKILLKRNLGKDFYISLDFPKKFLNSKYLDKP
jgi:hypothetical protein